MRSSTAERPPTAAAPGLLLGLLLLLLPRLAPAQSDDAALFPPKPEPAVYVHDYADWLTPHEEAGIEQKLRRYWDSTSTQIVVMIRPDIGDYDKASYAFELGNRWGIGRADKDNGVVMLIKSQPPDRGIFIATGYGTEGALPDITAGRIIRNTMAPYFRQEQYAQGIEAGLDDIIAALSGEFAPEQAEPLSTGSTMLFVLVLALSFFLITGFVVYAIRKSAKSITHDGTSTHRRRNRDDDHWGGGWWIGTGGGGGWSSGSGGSSWGGGGGSFGGGSFGGGGAGGDW